MRAAVFALAVLLVQPSFAAEKTLSVKASDLAKLMAETKMIAVVEPATPASDYKSDGDPETLEIVFLGKNGGPDHVSDDGEVIFQHENTSKKNIQKLLTEAFGIRALRRGLGE